MNIAPNFLIYGASVFWGRSIYRSTDRACDHSPEAERKAEVICRELGVSTVTFYKWKQRYGGMEASDVKRPKELEEENARLKKIYANLSLVYEALKVY